MRLCITPSNLKMMGVFSVPRLPGWSFQHPSASNFNNVYRLSYDDKNCQVFQRPPQYTVNKDAYSTLFCFKRKISRFCVPLQDHVTSYSPAIKFFNLREKGERP
jgi:hypothetical protein